MKTFVQFINEAYDPEVQGRSQIRKTGEGGRVGADRKKSAPEKRRMKAEAERKRAEAERRRKMEAHKEEFWYVVFVYLCLCIFVSLCRSMA